MPGYKRMMIGVLAMALCGCSATNSNQAEALSSGDYSAILPYETSDTRVKHLGIISDVDQRIQIEDGLMELSKAHFSPNSVAYKTHAFLNYDELDATDGSRGLLGTLRDDNPNGLNPGKNEDFDTGNGKVNGPTILVDIYELDWYNNDELKGISIGLVVNDRVGEEDTKIKRSNMQQYLEVSSTKLVNYMRSRFNEVTDSVPIYIAAYQLDSSNDDNMGGYIYSGYFQNSSQSYSKINEQWLRLPSSALSEKDAKTAEDFNNYKDALTAVIADNTYVIAEAEYINDTLTRMQINIEAHGKTAGELLAISQAAKENLSSFEETGCVYVVNIKSNETTYCMIKRDRNTRDTTVITSL